MSLSRQLLAVMLALCCCVNYTSLLLCIFTYFSCFFHRKKKKDKERKRLEEQALATENEEGTNKVYVDKRTPAQLAFDKLQEKRVFYKKFI